MISTLFIHSDEDYRCPLPEGLQMYSALQYHQVPSRIVIFNKENHELSRNGKPLNRIKDLTKLPVGSTIILNKVIKLSLICKNTIFVVYDMTCRGGCGYAENAVPLHPDKIMN
ncbi:MAG: prolyl oligopeptidase family serine peptidase [Prevotella sp.]|nr:prolyl oligopeptidase family serine peptidase [Prevotella sp.]